MRFMTSLFLTVLAVGVAFPVYAFNPLSRVYAFMGSFYDSVRWHCSDSYRREGAAAAVKLASLQARDRSLLYKLNAIQYNDVLYINKMADPVAQMMNVLYPSSTNQHREEARAQAQKFDTNFPLLKEKMEENLKFYDKLFPNDKNHKESSTMYPNELDAYRFAISSKKYDLEIEVAKRDGDEFAATHKKPEELFNFLPSMTFMKELRWHLERREALRKIRS